MKAGTTDVNIGTKVKITESNDPDLIGLTGVITHPFQGLMQPGETYILGIRLDKKGVFVDDIANLQVGDKFEVIDDTTDSKEIPRKWEYITTQLRRFNAPSKVVNAAVEIDNAMVRLGLGFHTDLWKKSFPICVKYEPSMYQLNKLIGSMGTCSACVESGYICSDCKLGAPRRCTPRSKHADLYYSIVKDWVADKVVRGD